MTIELGKKVRDSVSGFEGVATSRTVFLNKCVRIAVQPAIDKEGKLPDEKWFDEEQIEVIGEGVNSTKKLQTGGPQSNSPPSSMRR